MFVLFTNIANSSFLPLKRRARLKKPTIPVTDKLWRLC